MVGTFFSTYSHLLGNFCCWKHLKLKTNVDQAGLLFFVFVYLFLYRICKESACFPKWLTALKGEGKEIVVKFLGRDLKVFVGGLLSLFSMQWFLF